MQLHFRSVVKADIWRLGAVGSSLVVACLFNSCRTGGSATTAPVVTPASWRALVFVSNECPYSEVLTEHTLTDPHVQAALRQVEVQVVKDDESSGGRELQRRFATTAFPRTVFVDEHGPQDAIAGAPSVEEFLGQWARIRSHGSGTIAHHAQLVDSMPSEPIALHELGVKQLLLGQFAAAEQTWERIRSHGTPTAAELSLSLLSQLRGAQLFLLEADLERYDGRPRSVLMDELSAFLALPSTPPLVRIRAVRAMLRALAGVDDARERRLAANRAVRDGLVILADVPAIERDRFVSAGIESLWARSEPILEEERALARELLALHDSSSRTAVTIPSRLRAMALWIAGDRSGALDLARSSGIEGLVRSLEARGEDLEDARKR